MKSKITALVISTLAAIALAIPALASGWATITLDELPTGLISGEPQFVQFTVRQHGKTPLGGLAPKITFNSLDGAQRFTSDALPVSGQ